MFLKHHKLINFIICFIAVTLIYSGFQFMTDNRYDQQHKFTTEATTSVPADDNYILEVSETTVSSKDQIYETTLPISPTYRSDSATYSRSNMLAVILLFLGICLAIGTFFIPGGFESSYIELKLLVVYIGFIAASISYRPHSFLTLGTIAVLILSAISLMSIKAIILWIKERFTLSSTVPATLATRMIKLTGRKKSYLFTLMIWMFFTTLLGIYYIISDNLYVILLHADTNSFLIIDYDKSKYFIIAVLLFSFITTLVLILRYAASIEKLEANIALVSSNQNIEPDYGLFSEATKQLSKINESHREAIENAKQSERFRVDLISNVSHDLRTPLTSILGYSELLKDEKMSENGTKQLSELNQKAIYMRELVDSLFELTKVSNGVIPVKNEAIDIIKLLEQTIGFYSDQLAKNNLSVKTDYMVNSLIYNTDGTLLHQIISNLLGNAIKYTLSGSRIHLEVKDCVSSYNIKLVNISNYEMDFTPEEIVQRFARGDKARTTKGSGLGLAIAETYSEALGIGFNIEIDREQFIASLELPKKNI